MTIDITERKQREAELVALTLEKESEAGLFDATLSSINDLAYTFDLEGNWIYANKPLLELWGKSLHEIVGKSSLQLDYPPELAERLRLQVKQVIATRKPFRGETYFTDAAGVEDYHEYIFSPVSAPDGPVTAVSGTTRLVTERKKAEEQLRKRSERMQLLSETLGQLLSARNPETVVTELFPKVAKNLGAESYFNFMVNVRERVLELHSSAGISEETAQSIRRLEFGQAICGMVAQNKKAIVAEDIQKSDAENLAFVRNFGIQAYASNPLMVGERLLGTLAFASRTRVRFEADELEFIQVISQYTAIALDRMQTANALRQSESQISSIIEKSPVGVYLLDSQLRIRHVNPVAQPSAASGTLIGMTFAEALKMAGESEIHPELGQRLQGTLKSGESCFLSGSGIGAAGLAGAK
ncbi:MAG: PAS domain-containing protein, partial [Verrucomicrobiota bacterium]